MLRTFALILIASTVLAQERPLEMYGSPPPVDVSPYAHLNLTPEQLIAAQELEMAQWRLAQWSRITFPAQVRNLDAQIISLDAQLASLVRRDAEYLPFSKWSRGGNAFFLTQEDIRVDLVSGTLALDNLRKTRGDILQQQPVDYRAMLMEVERAKLRLRMTFQQPPPLEPPPRTARKF